MSMVNKHSLEAAVDRNPLIPLHMQLYHPPIQLHDTLDLSLFLSFSSHFLHFLLLVTAAHYI